MPSRRAQLRDVLLATQSFQHNADLLLRPNTASASPGGCRGQASRAYQRRKRISVSSSLLGGYDEPEILRSSSCQICLTGAEAGQLARYPKSNGQGRALE